MVQATRDIKSFSFETAAWRVESCGGWIQWIVIMLRYSLQLRHILHRRSLHGISNMYLRVVLEFFIFDSSPEATHLHCLVQIRIQKFEVRQVITYKDNLMRLQNLYRPKFWDVHQNTVLGNTFSVLLDFKPQLFVLLGLQLFHSGYLPVSEFFLNLVNWSFLLCAPVIFKSRNGKISCVSI